MILLDTHSFIWLASEPKRLLNAARTAIRAHPHRSIFRLSLQSDLVRLCG